MDVVWVWICFTVPKIGESVIIWICLRQHNTRLETWGGRDEENSVSWLEFGIKTKGEGMCVEMRQKGLIIWFICACIRLSLSKRRNIELGGFFYVFCLFVCFERFKNVTCSQTCTISESHTPGPSVVHTLGKFPSFSNFSELDLNNRLEIKANK